MFHRIIIISFLTFFLSTSAWAGIQAETFTLSPMFGVHVFEGDQNFNNNASMLGLGLGYNITEQAALEAIYTHTFAKGDTTADPDAKVRTVRLDALYHLMPEEAMVPYLAVGLGAINTNPKTGSSSDHFLANAGAGIKIFLNELIAWRLDVRYLLDFPKPENNLQFMSGLFFQFGEAAAAPAPVVIAEPEPEPVETIVATQPAPEPEPEPVDSDGDGVYDDKDKCPNTPKGAPVNSDGCPLDSDGDGVYDYKDKCPNTPKGAPVNSVGCPLDSDGDGVLDYLDACPGTPAGVSVDSKGCPTKLTLKINFGLNSDKIGPEYDGEIAKAAECINNYPGNLVYIDGHTDSQGAAAYNQKLSERRAAAVKNRLIEKFNIPAGRMTSRGFGESQPVADNATKQGRFENRRVDVACGATE